MNVFHNAVNGVTGFLPSARFFPLFLKLKRRKKKNNWVFCFLKLKKLFCFLLSNCLVELTNIVSLYLVFPHICVYAYLHMVAIMVHTMSSLIPSFAMGKIFFIYSKFNTNGLIELNAIFWHSSNKIFALLHKPRKPRTVSEIIILMRDESMVIP